MHDTWSSRLSELAPAGVAATRPLDRDGERRNEGFLWDAATGDRPVHQKHYLPDEDGVWEASWYGRGPDDFNPVEWRGARLGFLICTELWSMEDARAYGRKGVHLLLSPRMTEPATTGKWLAGGRAASIVAGAYCISSNRVSAPGAPARYGGCAWIIDPDGDVLVTTSLERPYATVELDTMVADRAKQTYPRTVFA